jgi:hypothetical protein
MSDATAMTIAALMMLSGSGLFASGFLFVVLRG